MFEDGYFARLLSPGIFNVRVAASEVIFQSSEGVTPAFLLESPHKQDQTTTDFGWRKTNGVLYLLSSGYFPKIAEGLYSQLCPTRWPPNWPLLLTRNQFISIWMWPIKLGYPSR
jgi:hypothetical protein